jgi:8-oxo-dGTP diphosphatase
MQDDTEFSGVKAALLYQGKLLVYQRDDTPGLRFAGLWDFFGGGREDNETPYECIRRELQEELEIDIDKRQIVFQSIFPAMHDPSQSAYFMVVNLTDENASSFRFGSEGQQYKFVEIDEFMNSDDFIPLLKPRLRSYLRTLSE